MDFKGSWDLHLPLIQFAYNNNYHTSIGMSPFEALYGRKCRTPICWEEVGEHRVYGPDIIQDSIEKVQIIRERLKTAQSRQKSYADNRRRDIEYEIGDYVFLKVSPWKGVFRFKKHGKLSPRFIGPFEIIGRIGAVAYRLELPPELSRVHNVFHVSMLRKYVHDPSHVIEMPLIEVNEDLTYEAEPVQILDTKEQVLRTKVIPLVKVLWRNQKIEEATWEREDVMFARYPHLFR
jgi:hypothetical protein